MFHRPLIDVPDFSSFCSTPPPSTTATHSLTRTTQTTPEARCRCCESNARCANRHNPNRRRLVFMIRQSKRLLHHRFQVRPCPAQCAELVKTYNELVNLLSKLDQQVLPLSSRLKQVNEICFPIPNSIYLGDLLCSPPDKIHTLSEQTISITTV